MAIEEAIYSMLSTDPGVQAVIAQRIFPSLTPEVGEPSDDLPAVAYFRVSAKRFYTNDTAPGTPVLAAPRFQFDCKAGTYGGARAAAAAITKVMRGFRGTVAGVDIRGIEELDDRDIYDQATKIYAVQKDFQVFHIEA